MFGLSAAVRAYLAKEPADMRKSFDALAASRYRSRFCSVVETRASPIFMHPPSKETRRLTLQLRLLT